MIYLVQHTTTYTYPGTVSICYNEVHLRPRESAWQTCTDYDLVVRPAPGVMNLYNDFFGNHVAFFTVQEPHHTLTVMAHSTVTITPDPLPAPAATPPWESVRDGLRYDTGPDGLQAYQHTFASPYVPLSPRLRHYAAPSFPPGRPVLAAVLELTQRIYRDFTYDPKATSISTPVHTVLRMRRGVCQDFAHLQIGCLRSLGLAARYVSGYLVTQPPPGRPRLVGADASHAWVAVYCPGHGWIDADPTNNVLPSDRHVTVAIGRDYSDVSPIKGVFLGGGQHIMRVAVDVTPVVG